MGLKIKVDGVEQNTSNMASNSEINNESTDAMWVIVNENRQLKERLYTLEAKLDRVKEILNR